MYSKRKENSLRDIPLDLAPPPAPFLQITPNDKADAMRMSELAQAILERGDHELRTHIVKNLLDLKGDLPAFVNARDVRGRTPLMHAIADHATDILPLLIESKNVELVSKDRFGNTPLMYAVGHGYENVVRLLLSGLKKKVNNDDRIMLNYLHMENYDGETALELALKAGHEECALALSEFLNEAVKNEKSRKTSIAYRLGFGKRSPPMQQRKMSLGKKNGIRESQASCMARRKSLGDEEMPSPLAIIFNKRKSSS